MTGGRYHVPLTLRSTESNPIPCPISSVYFSGTRRNILSETYLYDVHRVRVLKEPDMALVFPDGQRVPISRKNGLYYLSADLAPAPPCTAAAIREAALVTARQLGREPMASLWAARLGCSGDGLARFAKATINSGLGDTITPAQRQIADVDVFRKQASLTRRPVPRAAPPQLASTTPGSVWSVDEWGPCASGAVGKSNLKYHVVAVDCFSGFNRTALLRSMKASDLNAFLEQLVAEEARLGHVVRTFRVDSIV